MYENLCSVYDKLMVEENNIYYKKLKKFIINNNFKGKSIHELACGTGSIAIRLAADGFEVTGTDLSKEMIEIAKDKNEHNSNKCDFYVMDMREFNHTNKYDLICCIFDGFTYINSIDMLESIFDNIKNHLNPGGYFIFDIFSYTKYKELYTKQTTEKNYIEVDNKTLFWTEKYSDNKIDVNIKIYKKYDNNKFDEFEENQEEYMYEDNEINDICKNKFQIIDEEFMDIRRIIYCKGLKE